ncbi:3-deoxy-manno-octulosonate cytidylyltransferase [secondary endosymbiont of Ctenarytaina eucalypti]|uniref:3-deoxy-manno-octulosonate cytidylyltransferase n=1 Tax=secondary endosymbiont of Ctenarytaina eucalypti TaxID=1199245 RepID=J3Z3V3_9ENTR|nr:3-deoxy-manno-octulosonate cytidylyltransferase [secondary endosymbiont of Ctenarytaina eucalypti]AFP84899.1 3-deoxy-D-manno-octulosonate cytidylyltransferase [secondary endosymbiont of Ctenarytaina eucalypti]
MSFIAIIPARFASRRLPGKPLADINGKPMVVRVMERAKASGADRVIVAADHADVVKAVERAGGEVCLTRGNYQFGTQRLQEVVDRYDVPDDQVIVNVQGDEPLIPPTLISQVVENLASTDASMTTLAVPITTSEEAFNQNAVKVVVSSQGYALYFSRATIPWNHSGFACGRDHLSHFLLRHIGLYAYRADFIRRYVRWSASPLEKIESLEQLRVLWHGEKIHVAMASVESFIGVDTMEALTQVRLLQKQLG